MPPRQTPPDPDPVNAAGLIYRVFSRWRVLLGALAAVLVVAAVFVLVGWLAGPVRIELGPIGVETP